MTDLLTVELVITCPLSRLYKEGKKSSWKARGFITKSTVHLYYLRTENIKEATAKVFGGLQAKSKVRIKYLEVKISELHLVWVWFGGYIKKLALSSPGLYRPFKGIKKCFGYKFTAKFHGCVQKVERYK